MARGDDRERKLGDQLEEAGWVVVRSAGSLGPIDLMCLKRGQRPLLVQVKSDKDNPYANFRPKARYELMRLGRLSDADVWLVWWPPDRKPPRWIPPSSWP